LGHRAITAACDAGSTLTIPAVVHGSPPIATHTVFKRPVRPAQTVEDGGGEVVEEDVVEVEDVVDEDVVVEESVVEPVTEDEVVEDLESLLDVALVEVLLREELEENVILEGKVEEPVGTVLETSVAVVDVLLPESLGEVEETPPHKPSIRGSTRRMIIG
jgi:hypothetical protein